MRLPRRRRRRISLIYQRQQGDDSDSDGDDGSSSRRTLPTTAPFTTSTTTLPTSPTPTPPPIPVPPLDQPPTSSVPVVSTSNRPIPPSLDQTRPPTTITITSETPPSTVNTPSDRTGATSTVTMVITPIPSATFTPNELQAGSIAAIVIGCSVVAFLLAICVVLGFRRFRIRRHQVSSSRVPAYPPTISSFCPKEYVGTPYSAYFTHPGSSMVTLPSFVVPRSAFSTPATSNFAHNEVPVPPVPPLPLPLPRPRRSRPINIITSSPKHRDRSPPRSALQRQSTKHSRFSAISDLAPRTPTLEDDCLEDWRIFAPSSTSCCGSEFAQAEGGPSTKRPPSTPFSYEQSQYTIDRLASELVLGSYADLDEVMLASRRHALTTHADSSLLRSSRSKDSPLPALPSS